MAARELGAEVHYIVSTDRYGMTVDLKDLRTKISTQVEARSALHVAAGVGRDAAELQRLEFTSGTNSKLEATGGLKHFARPEWQATGEGSVEGRRRSGRGQSGGLGAGRRLGGLEGHRWAECAGV